MAKDMKERIPAKDDPGMLSFVYTAPISALIHLRGRKPQKTEEAAEYEEVSFS